MRRSVSSTTAISSRCGIPPIKASRRTRRPSSQRSAPTLRWRRVLPFVLRDARPRCLRNSKGAAALWGSRRRRDDLSRSGAACRPRRRQRSLRGHHRGPLGRDVHRTRYEDDLLTDRPRRSQDRVGDARNAGRRQGIASTHRSSRRLRSSRRAVSGERRAYTANDIFRDPSWRKRDAEGALRVSVEDAQALGLVAGTRAHHHAAGSAEASIEISEAMLPGHASCPTARLDFVDEDGRREFRCRAERAGHRRGGAMRTRARRGTSTCLPDQAVNRAAVSSGYPGRWRRVRHCDVSRDS